MSNDFIEVEVNSVSLC